MLPFNQGALKALAESVDDVEGKMKIFEVQNGSVAVHSGRVITRVGNFTPLDDDQYKFGSNDPVVGQALAPWFLRFDEIKCYFTVELKLPVVTRFYNSLKKWLTDKPKNALTPIVTLSFTRIDSTKFLLELKGTGSKSHPNLHLSLELEIQDLENYFDRSFALNANELADALVLFAKLKAESGTLFVHYTESAKDPIFFRVDEDDAHGHEILVGWPFLSPKKDEAVKITQSEPNDESESDGDDDSDDESLGESVAKGAAKVQNNIRQLF